MGRVLVGIIGAGFSAGLHVEAIHLGNESK